MAPFKRTDRFSVIDQRAVLFDYRFHHSSGQASVPIIRRHRRSYFKMPAIDFARPARVQGTLCLLSLQMMACFKVSLRCGCLLSLGCLLQSFISGCSQKDDQWQSVQSEHRAQTTELTVGNSSVYAGITYIFL